MEQKDIMDLELEFIFPIISGKVSTAINRKMHRNFRKTGIDITPEQWTVLASLWKADGVSQQRLCDATFKDKPSMTRLVDNLERQSLVFRQTPASDRRSNLIFLTEKGKAIQKQADMAVSEAIGQALEGIDEKGIEQMKKMLKLIFENIKESLK